VARTSQRCPASGQNDTSLHVAGGKGLPSEITPYIFLPQLQPHSNRTFDPAVAIGDVAIVLLKRRWPDGVNCPRCGNVKVFPVKTMTLKWQCYECETVKGAGYRFWHHL
jgi:transposase-like zinc ribbon protein